MKTTTIHLDGELDTTPDETYKQAVERIIERDDNLCEMVGYMGHADGSAIMVQTSEAKCILKYTGMGILMRAIVNGHIVWQMP